MEETAKFEILEAIHTLAEVMDCRFESIDSRFESIDSRFGSIGSRFDKIDRRFDRIESQMVTKDYLDNKLGDLRGDLIALAGKSNTKLCVFVEEMVKEGSLKRKTANHILAMEPFAK